MTTTEINFNGLFLFHEAKTARIFESFQMNDDTNLTNDTNSIKEEDLSSISSMKIMKTKRNRKKACINENNLTLKEIVGKRTKNTTKLADEKKTPEENFLNMSKKIKKDENKITSASFAKRQHTQKWNFEETRRFYKVIFFFH